jgi:predicted nucleic acid-binding protein
MSVKSFVDSNVLLYAHDREAGEKGAAAKELLRRLWKEQQGVLSTQVLQEFCVNVRKKFRQPMSSTQLRDAVLVYGNWPLVVNTASSVLRGLEIEQRYQLSFWDSMILQAAEISGCEVLYSEDFSHGQQYAGVRAINPFLG